MPPTIKAGFPLASDGSVAGLLTLVAPFLYSIGYATFWVTICTVAWGSVLLVACLLKK
jgi:hypothetical protein